jgi:hypothetical protein
MKVIKSAKNPLKFQIVDSNGDVIGSVNVGNESEARELMAKFGGSTQPSKQQAKAKDGVEMLAKAFKAVKGVSKQFVLRGC